MRTHLQRSASAPKVQPARGCMNTYEQGFDLVHRYPADRQRNARGVRCHCRLIAWLGTIY